MDTRRSGFAEVEAVARNGCEKSVEERKENEQNSESLKKLIRHLEFGKV